MRFDIVYAPRPAFARSNARLRDGRGLGWRCTWRGHLLTLLTDAELEASPSGREARGRVTLEDGQSLAFSLVFSEHDVLVLAPLGEQAGERAERTETWWCEWSALTRYSGPHRESVLRSAITLKMMTYGLSGAVVAAPTTSLPETIGGTRKRGLPLLLAARRLAHDARLPDPRPHARGRRVLRLAAAYDPALPAVSRRRL